MSDKYPHPENEPQMVAETVTNTIIIPVTVTSMGNYTKESLAKELNEYARKLVSQDNALHPYTLEELKARIDEGEQQMEAGDVVSGDIIHNEMRDYIKSIKA